VDVVLSLHGRAAIALVLYLSTVGVWGLILGVRGVGPTPNFQGALIIAEVAVIAQGALGVAAFFSRSPAQSLHVLYGFALALALPLATTLVRKREPRAASFAFGFIALFAAGLAIRGITTA
jgi:heme A synthase